tara:strand:- start:706 stop:909 length:204 start_codon:yes stop_codon:yes gene_type:complete
MSKVIHFKGLNGLRAFTAIAVVISPVILDMGKFGLVDIIFGGDSNGSPKGLLLASYGISIFFTPGGF